MSVRSMETLAGGRWVSSGEWVDVFDPTDVREPAVRVPALTAEDVRRAYDDAEAGFAVWRGTSPFSRARVMYDAAALLRARVAEIAEDLVTEMGKTRAEAQGEVGKAADFLEYYASVARDGYGTLIHDARPQTKASFHREPIGVVLAITPWNDPLLTPARKLAPALAAGNSAVLKPASETPMSSLHLARALHDAGLPAGVLNVVTGRTADISDALLGDERIAALTFTGSNAVGDRIRLALAARNVRFQAELGGKNATVVLADADLDAAAGAVVAAAFGQAGQRCTATSRVLVERSVHDRFAELLREKATALRVGPGKDPATSVGPLVSPAQRDSVLGDIALAVKQGATVCTGGDVPAGDALANGCYVSPTILTGVTPEMDIWRHEVFGPVLVLRPVDGLDEAIDGVNDSDFGLAAAVFTQNLAAAHRFIDEADCGQVAVNTTTSGWDVHHPFGGFRDSGSPFKEQGFEALRFYTRVKTVAIHFGA
ncbi:aldehyde dehydrogenase family protein [Planomonospora venezuelensis]|uniref:Aldehyde dehydrogenase (NAD+) n=1 Tax=Planomonospora venezuelensis TaxID=1999 RepID=A0A841DGG0_PLAVE|nr:aldehyde dehydrogenase family protein [Planomonospora venezuelensis]MBB5967388.1 aldehyde dehydrogenase (NAD+) [Planomonospora venezuelensis]GIN05306.1 aldehyde dehydrogenase [Planomonospora venezuelensis]